MATLAPAYRGRNKDRSRRFGWYYHAGAVWLHLRHDGVLNVWPQVDPDQIEWEPFDFELMPDVVRREISARTIFEEGGAA